MILAMDAMGGDHAPVEPIIAAVNWAARSDDKILLVGAQDIIAEELRKTGYTGGRIEIVHASQVAEMDDAPTTVVRRKKDASIMVATRLVQEGRADAVLSCGSTGAQMVAAIFILGRMEGIDRPPVLAALPTRQGGQSVLIDVGANVDCRPEQLLQFALLGQIYVTSLSGKAEPLVMLLNNGSEEGKGNSLAQAAQTLLREDPRINFGGNLEGREIFAGTADVIVCDGFVGNILLKTVEGTAAYMTAISAEETGSIPRGFERVDYSKTGGAPLLGVNGVSIVCHGSSKHEAIYHGIRMAKECWLRDLVSRQQAVLNVNGEENNKQEE